MIEHIGCNMLDAFGRIFERTGEHNPNSIFEDATQAQQAQPATAQQSENDQEPVQQQAQTPNDIYNVAVKKFTEEYANSIPADCDTPHITQEEVRDIATSYYMPLIADFESADDETRNKIYRYIVAAINKHVRSLKGEQVEENEPDVDDDDMVWGDLAPDPDEPEGEKKKKKKKKENGEKMQHDHEWVKRQGRTADSLKKTFAW